MKVLVIEDEKLAQEYLINMLLDTGYDLQIAGTCNSLKSAIKWLIENGQPDLIFMDIDLGDGLCFEVFDVVDISSPVIFTTAYDEYAIQAFKVNSIDYLLKPISSKELLQALNKYTRLSANVAHHQEVDKVARLLSEKHKSRFLIRIGQHIKSLPADDVMFFESRDKATYATGIDKRSYLIDYSLDKLESMMNPQQFFRINRGYIINFSSIVDIINYSGSRLKVTLRGCTDKDIIVSRERVNDFKGWLDR